MHVGLRNTMFLTILLRKVAVSCVTGYADWNIPDRSKHRSDILKSLVSRFESLNFVHENL